MIIQWLKLCSKIKTHSQVKWKDRTLQISDKDSKILLEFIDLSGELINKKTRFQQN